MAHEKKMKQERFRRTKITRIQMHHCHRLKKPVAPLQLHPCASHSLATLQHTPEKQQDTDRSAK